MTFEQGGGNASGGADQISVSIGTANADRLVIGEGFNTENMSALTYAGAAMTNRLSVGGAGHINYKLNAASGVNSLLSDGAGANGATFVCGAVFSGVDQADPFGGDDAVTGSQSRSVTSDLNGSMAVAVVGGAILVSAVFSCLLSIWAVS